MLNMEVRYNILMSVQKIKCVICHEEYPLDEMIGDVCIDCALNSMKHDDLIDIH